MIFTADNLPEAARALPTDPGTYLKGGFYLLNDYTARILNRLDAAHGGWLSALLNGTAPALTDEPPKVTKADAVSALAAFDHADGEHDNLAMRAVLRADRARVWQTHRPAPADPVRFALEKVSDEEFQAMLALACSMRWVEKDGRELFGHQCAQIVRAELARLLPVVEPPKQWADLTDEDFAGMYSKAVDASCFNTHEDWPVRRKAAGRVLRECFEAYAPPPRKVEVTPEVMRAFRDAWDASAASWVVGSDAGFGSFLQNHIDGVRAALAVANSQAEARESEETARLKGEVDRLTKERDDWQAKAAWYEGGLEATKNEERRQTKAAMAISRNLDDLNREFLAPRAHADKLEKMLTTTTGVKLWESFEHSQDGQTWTRAFFADCRASFDGRLGLANYANLRQTPTPAVEPLKRWKIANADEFTDDVEYFVTKPMTRADAEKRGKVIGEAGK